jgi:uncharacterized protein YbjT (DUF2867 family)
MTSKTVLVIGARGFLGSKVLDAVLAKKKYKVKALIREGSNASKVEALGVEILRGDMMDKASLEAAFKDVDVIINTANGYGQGHPEIDTEGANNVVDAAAACKVSRYIYCGVLTSEKAPDVDHFYNKYLAEEYMRTKEVPFISLRPGAFLDQADDYLGDGIKRGSSFALYAWDKTVPIGMIYTPDLAQYFADCIDLPEDANGKCLEVGWTRPISMEEVVSICATKLDRSISCYALPWFIRMTTIYTVGLVSPFWSEMMKMFNYLSNGDYVNTTEDQKKYFGEPPTPEEAITVFIEQLKAEKEEAEKEEKKEAETATKEK